MINGFQTVMGIVKTAIAVLPFLALCFLSKKINLHKPYRNRQYLMPVFALVYVVVLLITMNSINNWLMGVINKIPEWLASLLNASWMPASMVEFLRRPINAISDFIKSLNLGYWIFFISNTAVVLLYFAYKGICLGAMKAIFGKNDTLHYRVSGVFYECFPERDVWCLKDSFVQMRTLFKALYYTVVVASSVIMVISGRLYLHGLLATVYYPVAGVILIGELFFYLDGATKREYTKNILGEDENAYKTVNYSLLRRYLRNLFGDKLLSENTSVNNALEYNVTNEEILEKLLNDPDPKVVNMASFYSRLNQLGLSLDHNYLLSSLDLLNGKSILFNNPFYQDLIPYAFYPMNRTLLSGQKVMVVLGRHAIEDDVEQWLMDGIESVTNIPTLWKIGVLDRSGPDVDIGIVTRSKVLDVRMHIENEEFLKQVGFVVIIEPSKLVSTAQIGLNLLVKKCRGNEEKNIVYCMCDRNCDGLVDAMSHVLMTSLTEVSATNKHQGTSSYMCWEADNEYLHHRLFPNVSRYLGLGTELSFAALKNQVSNTAWYGGDAFPVTDIRWIDRQYYYDLMKYAALPTSQDAMNEYFHTSPNIWSADIRKNNYFTVEDESYNMFEMIRHFATRSTEQGFINVVSSDYLLKDYMAANDSIFETDAKAIPYFVADYARTHRNVILRLMLLMSISQLDEETIRKEFSLISLPVMNVREQIWFEIFKCLSSADTITALPENYEEAVKEVKRCTIPSANGDAREFAINIIKEEKKYNYEIGRLETVYFITDPRFVEGFVNDLKSSSYVAEDEKGETYFLGSELSGHIYQKYLPGQFFTFSGKYYEMRYLTSDNQVLVRRAADHIHDRPEYRQLREYTVSAIRPSACIGAVQDIEGIKVVREYADIAVTTDGYYRMEQYHDFSTAKKILFKGEKSRIPQRTYQNKTVLRIDLPSQDGAFTPRVRYTITVLLNEVFRTLFADNQPYIVAVTDDSHIGDDADCRPLTYSIHGNGTEIMTDSIYIIEDSQIDIGLLITVERNLHRIFEILHDYLLWNKKEVARSLTPPPPIKPQEIQPRDIEDEQAAQKKENIFKRIWKAIKNFFKRIWSAIKNFFRKLFSPFHRQKKKDGQREPGDGETPVIPPAGDSEDKDKTKSDDDNTPTDEDDMPTDTDEAPTDEDDTLADEDEVPIDKEDTPADEDDTPADTDDTSTDEDCTPLDEDEAPTDMDNASTDEDEVPTNTNDMSADDGEADDASESREISPMPPADAPGLDATQMVTELNTGRKAPFDFSRTPYHERYYLLYGYAGEPDTLDSNLTLKYLSGLGFASNPLRDARKGKRIAKYVEATFTPNKKNARYCDFCGCEIYGVEYETLADGRDRCVQCGRTAVKTEEEFRRIYEDVKRNLEAFFAIKINTGIRVEMVNSQKLHRKLKRAFVPTPYQDGRVLGVAIKDKTGYTLMIENGSPRIQAMLTIAHELTHIWQYLNWKDKHIVRTYGRAMRNEIYEGMAKWVEIQYAYLINESSVAKREEIITAHRNDHYGHGYIRYRANYPLSTGTVITGTTPFMNLETPLDPMYCGEVTVLLDPNNGGRGYDDIDPSDDRDDWDPEDEEEDGDRGDDGSTDRTPMDDTFFRDPDSVARYAYNCLNEQEKELYDLLCDAVMHFAPAITAFPDWVRWDDLTKVCDYLLIDHPEIDWFRHSGVSGSSEKETGRLLKCELTYCLTQEESEKRNAATENAVQEFLSGITDSMGDYEVALTLHDNMVRLVDYDSLTLERTKKAKKPQNEPDDLRSLYGVFVNKKAVCGGYAKALQYLFNRAGLECVYVRGETTDGFHAWNLAKISGDYYYIDVTWDDHSDTKKEENYSDEITYDYFCVTTEEILRDHKPDDTLPMPECSALVCNYYYRNHLLLDEYDLAKVRAIVKQQVADGVYSIRLKAANKTVYKAMYANLIQEQKIRDIIGYLNLDPKTRVSSAYSHLHIPEKRVIGIYLKKI